MNTNDFLKRVEKTAIEFASFSRNKSEVVKTSDNILLTAYTTEIHKRLEKIELFLNIEYDEEE